MDEMEKLLDGMGHGEKLLVLALGITQGLIDKGILIGVVPLSDKGLRVYQALVDSGFDPPKEELQECLAQHFTPRLFGLG